MPPAHKVAILSPVWSAAFQRMVRGALTYADAHPRIIMREFRLPRGFGRSNRIIQTMQSWKPDGLLCYLEEAELGRLLKMLPTPPVVNTCASSPRAGVTVVAGRFSSQAELAVRHLHHQELQSIALVLLESVPKMQVNFIDVFNRIVRPTKATHASFFEVIPSGLLDNPGASVSPVPKRLAAWLQKLPKPAGIFCPQDGGGGYLVRVCQALGLRVPADISVVGADDVDICLACEPTLTSVLNSGEQVGREAMYQLDQMMHGHPGQTEVVRVNAVDLHVRESTGLKTAEICDIAAALDHIEQHACRGLTVEQLVRATQKVSKVTFHKHFLAATGQSPGQAILQRQMSEARRLLAETRLSITLVAEYCGFGSSSDFARSFRRLEGQSPGDYRASHGRPSR